MPLAVRVRLHGASDAHRELVADAERWTNEVRARGGEGADLWVEKVHFDTRTPIDLESLRGQIAGLEAQVAESTIVLTLQTDITKSPITTTTTDDGPKFGDGVENAWKALVTVINAIVVGLAVLAPIAILVGLIWMIVRLARRNRKPTEVAAAPTPAEAQPGAEGN